MARKQVRRRAPQAFARGRDRPPAEVVVRYVCPVCKDDHPRDRCPRREDAREVKQMVGIDIAFPP